MQQSLVSRTRRAGRLHATAVLLVSLLAPVSSASAATIVVNTTDDEFITDGDCSLREAVFAANFNTAFDACSRGVGADTITFSVIGTVTLSSSLSLPFLSEVLTLSGPGAANLTISGNNAVGVLQNFSNGLTVRDLTIANGNALQGAGILNGRGILTVINSTFSNNRANSQGGAIQNLNNATLIVDHSAFSGNSASDTAGAISNVGTLIVRHSSFTSNNAGRVAGAIISLGGTASDSSFSNNTAGILGGALVNSGALMTVTNSTFFNNSASGNSGTGGAIDNGGAVGSALTVTNSTFSGNRAGFLGGGIRNELDATLTVTNCTFTANEARPGGGGAISNRGTGTLHNTIVASNPGGNCGGAIIDAGGNFSYPDGSCPGPNVDPLLGPLADNGGPTLTHALQACSPAIDAAFDVDCPSTDQRGVSRPFGPHCDIGAYESQAPPNHPPSADAGLDQFVPAGPTCAAEVTLHGEGSSDPDAGDTLTYTWSGAVSATGATPTVSLLPGFHAISLDVSDGLCSDTDDVVVIVADETGPVFSGVPGPIVAECTSATGTAVSVPLPTATDNCDGAVPVGSDAPATFPLGTTNVVFTASDAQSNVAVANTTVTVGDTTGPAITGLTATPNVLWPPNHKMVAVTLAVSASDLCGTTSCRIVSVASNEPVSDPAGDWQITGPLTLDLRAERLGSGSGRVYTITVECGDGAANASTRTVTVTVPKSQGSQ